MVKFPKRVYTTEEVERARRLVESGHRHRLRIKGSLHFQEKVKEVLKFIKTAEFYSYLRTYIRQIVQIDGFSQLRETEAAIWTNMQLLEDSVEAASFFVQKASQMKEFLEGKIYYGGTAEARSIEKRIEFLKALKTRSKESAVKNECERILKKWAESTFVF